VIRDLILQTRSCRRYYQDIAIKPETLRELVDLARCSAAGGNIQALKYILSCDSGKNALIFPHLAWAIQLKDWHGPVEGERPSAYIIILQDTKISTYNGCDHGVAAQSIVLGAREKGIGACIHGAGKKDALRKALEIPQHYEILLIISLGLPREKVVLETTGPDGNTNYWRDSDGVHHVPKRPLDEIIIG
jgi:nitroreductase